MPDAITRKSCGRSQELEELENLLSSQKVLVIAGLPGIGKTSFLQAFAGLLNNRQDFSGRILWISCRKGWNEQDLFAEITQKTVELTGETKFFQVKVSASDIISMLEENELLLFLDDFQWIENPATIELVREGRFLKKGHLVIATRKRISLPPLELIEIHEKRLEGLKQEDAELLMDQLLELHGIEKLDAVQKDRIFHKVKGHPYSLKLFISLLVTGGYSLDSLLESASEFDEERERHLLEQVWNTFETAEQVILKFLSVLRIPIKLEEFPSLFDRHSRTALRKLLDNYLVESTSEGRVYLHDLMRNRATENLAETDRIRFHTEVADIFAAKRKPVLGELKEAYFHYREAGRNELAVDVLSKLAYEILIRGEESENIYHLLDQALEGECGDKREILLKNRIELLIYWRQFAEAEAMLGRLEKKINRDFLSAKLNFRRGQFSEAVRLFESGLAKNPTRDEQADAYSTLALCYNYLGNLAGAEEYFRKALSEVREDCHPFFQAKNFLNLGIFLAHRGEVYKAIESLERAEKIFREYNALGRLANVLYNKAVFYFDIMELGKIRKYLDESTDVRENIKDKYGLVYNYSMRAELYFLEGDYRQSKAENRKALSLAERKSWIFPMAFVNSALGLVETRLGNPQAAEQHHKAALSYFDKIDYPVQKEWAHLNYAQFLLCERRIDEALTYLMQVKTFAESCSQQELLSRVLFFLYAAEKLKADEHCSVYNEEYNKTREKLPEQFRKRLDVEFQWFIENVLKSGSGIVLSRRQGSLACNQEELEDFRKQGKTCAFFADFLNRELFVDGKKVPFFKKKVLVTLLTILVRNPGKLISPEEIFRAVWGRKYESDSDGANLRMNISRLRKALGSDSERFIRSSAEESGYYFDSESDYMLILPE
ncbi:MAG: winged helix-turn-helix domain-containing protein [Candidatus Wallbacteria bacterium]|nr:winged helix-turn-helix domain-containing protein [Candidatus Wallbacteria bacterium]